MGYRPIFLCSYKTIFGETEGEGEGEGGEDKEEGEGEEEKRKKEYCYLKQQLPSEGKADGSC